MTDQLSKQIERCRKINGGPESNNFTSADRDLAIANAEETSSLRGTFDKFVEVQGLLHDRCDEERGGLWDAMNGVRSEVGKTGKQAARTEGLIIGKGRGKKDLFYDNYHNYRGCWHRS